MSHISVRPLSADESDLLQSLFDLAISGTNQGIAKISATQFENRTFSGGSGGGTWGSITGTLSNQTDLQAALDAKQRRITFGLDNQIPFTNSSLNDFDYSSNFTFDGTTLALATTNITMTGDLATSSGRVNAGYFKDINVASNGTLTFVTAGSKQITINQATIKFNDTGNGTYIGLTGASMSGGNQTITLPDATGTVALTSNLSAYVPTSTTITIAGTANQITSSAGAQDLSANRTWTLSLPNDLRLTSASVGTNADSVPTLSSTSTFTNKTLTSPAINTATLGGHQTMLENAAFLVDPVMSADGKYNGWIRAGTAGTTLAFGDLCYLDPTDSRWELVDANAAAGADGDARGILGICVLAAAADGDPTIMLRYGWVRADTAFPTFTVNNPVYVSETAGDVTGTQPTTTDVVIRIVGYGETGDELFFNPENDWITHT